MILAAEMVTTSLNMPQMLRVTTEVLFRSANSEAVIKKARTPGKSRMPTPSATPLSVVKIPSPFPRGTKPSTGIAIIARLRNIIGARKKIVLNGLLVAGFRRSRICVKAQRKPEKNEAEMMRPKPRALKSVSPATIMMTPTVIVAMMSTSLIEGVSSRKRKAKSRIKAKAEDLHIAGQSSTVLVLCLN